MWPVMGEIRRPQCHVGMAVADGHPAGEGMRAHWCDLPAHHDGIDHRCAQCGIWFRPTWWDRVGLVYSDIADLVRERWDYALQATVCRWFSHKVTAMQKDGYAWTTCSRCGHMEGTHPLIGEL